ncbi:inositol monophosphatase [Puniceicoccaceae bacterium K14]|nr:inositol monophosphatase [Puniceicoccaceae bacterium K14]
MQNLIEVAKRACKAAGRALVDCRHDQTIESFEHDLKSSADVVADNVIKEILEETGIEVLSEEGSTKSLHQPLWIVDPLDGTVNYVKGNPLNCVSIAYWEGDVIIFGVIYDFSSDEIYVGGKDFPTSCNGKLVTVSTCSRLSEAIVTTGFPNGSSYSEESLLQYVNKVRSCRKVRLLGSAALSLAWLSRSWVDCYMEEGIYLWDVAAGLALVEGAGGQFSIDNIDDRSLRVNVRAVATGQLLSGIEASSKV